MQNTLDTGGNAKVADEMELARLTNPAVRRIYYVPSKTPGRSYRLIEQGLRNNQKIALVERSEEAEFVFYHYQAYDPACTTRADKTVFIDFDDDPAKIYPVGCRTYFKRSWVASSGAIRAPLPRPCHHFPVWYAIMDEFIVPEPLAKDISFGCYLRENQNVRKGVLKVAQLVHAEKKWVGPVNESSRNVFDRDYLSMLKRSKIVLTCHPDSWEGDSRTWEALANKALVLVDKIYTPHRFPLIDRKHVVEYDRGKLELLRDVIEHYLQHPDEAEAIAQQGHDYAMAHHRTEHRIDDMLAVIEQQDAARAADHARPRRPGSRGPDYSDSECLSMATPE